MFTSRQETLSCLCSLKEQQQCCLESLDLSFPTRFIILESELITGTIVPIQLTQTWIFGTKLIFLFSSLFFSFLMSLPIPIIPEPFHSCPIWPSPIDHIVKFGNHCSILNWNWNQDYIHLSLCYVHLCMLLLQ